MSRHVTSRRVGLLAVLVLVLGAFAAVPTIAEEPLDADCRTYTVGASAAEECDVTGTQLEVGVGTFEPTLGADADGTLYYARADRENGVLIGFGAGTSKSSDGGQTWEDITPELAGRDMPPETNDPMLYVDPGTGRVFQFHMSPILTCSIMSFTDDGGDTWTTNPYGCGPTAVWDHQTMVAATPRVFDTVGYPNVLHQCVNAVYAAMCSRSLDGGLTWSPGAPAYPNTWLNTGRGAQHGHLQAAPDGTVYLPTPMGARAPAVFVTEDDGLTWRESVIADIDIPFTDPAVAVDSDGNVYASFVDPAGTLYFAVSTDKAQTWSEAVPIAPGVTATLPAMTVGDPGEVAIAFPGTDDLPDGFATPGGAVTPNTVEWGGYITYSENALEEAPTFTTVNGTGDDPLMRGRNACASGGRCTYQVDFIDVVHGPDGQIYASLADGCTKQCATGQSLNNNENHGRGVVVTLDGVSLCDSVCGEFAGASTASSDTTSVVLATQAQTSTGEVDLATGPFDAAAVWNYWLQADRERRAWASGQAIR